MYPPEAISHSAAEKIDAAPEKVRTISKRNTRFAVNPYPATDKTAGGSAKPGAAAAAGSSNALGDDGDGNDSPKVNGYGFVVTPSPGMRQPCQHH